MTTPAQHSFITSLLEKKDVPADLRADIEARLDAAPTSLASQWIDALKALGWATSKPSPRFTNPLLAELPLSRYALPYEPLRSALLYTRASGDGDDSLLFIEVAEFRGTRYARKLVGGGDTDFRRERINPQDLNAILMAIATDPVGYAQKFGEHFVCCGRCGRPLTDDLSRSFWLGPECRKILGVA